MKHLEEHDRSYLSHMTRTLKISFLSFKVSFFATIHALTPFIFTNAASNALLDLYDFTFEDDGE